MSSARADPMPFDGGKARRGGLEGPAHTIREVTEQAQIRFAPSAALRKVGGAGVTGNSRTDDAVPAARRRAVVRPPRG